MTKSILTLSVLAMVGMPFAAQASFITGVLNITGEVNITLGSLAFVNNDWTGDPLQQGGFTVLANTTGTIDNINNPPEVTTPPGSFAPVADFMTTAVPNITFTLTDLRMGIDGAAGCSALPPAAGQVCTPNLPDQSPFNLQNLSGSSSSASFIIDGLEVDSLTGLSTPFIGTFTTPFVLQNFQTVLLDVEEGATLTESFSAQIAVPPSGTPEPSSLLELIMGIGLVGVSLVYRKKLKRA